MPDPTPVSLPAGFAPAYAVGFSDAAENLVLVSDSLRLPVAPVPQAPAALSGQTSVSLEAGPFDAVPGRVVTVTLGGEWEGTVSLLRSIDGGTTRAALRVAGQPWAIYSVPGCEQAWLESEEGASFYLDIRLVSGTLAYRVSQ